MGAYVIRRLIQMVVTLLVASLVVYGAMQLVPGDPVVAMFFPNVPSPERLETIREELGLNKPFVVRYFDWLGGLFHGDLGQSYKQYRPVADILVQNIPPTVELAIAGVLVSLAIGVPVGILAGVTESKLVDNLAMLFALIGVSAPSFWLGILLMLVFSLYLGWFPCYGTGGIAKLVLPALTLGLYGGGYLTRFVRSSVLEVKYEDYVTTARAKGLTEFAVVLRHVLRNALIPVVTMAGMLAGYLVQALLLFSVGIFILVNMLVDIAYAFIDPRIRYD